MNNSKCFIIMLERAPLTCTCSKDLPGKDRLKNPRNLVLKHNKTMSYTRTITLLCLFLEVFPVLIVIFGPFDLLRG